MAPPSSVKLVHTTSNYNKILPGETFTVDPDIQVRALWCYCVPATAPHCCEHHLRRVALGAAAFQEWHEDNDWTLYYVNERKGDAPGYKFYKYVLVPENEQGRAALAKCKQHKKYQKIAQVANVAAEDLLAALGRYYRSEFGTLADVSNENGKIVWHFHVGILGGMPFGNYVDENKEEWEELKPDLPEVHKAKTDQGQDQEADDEEIFRKFAFESDENEEWTTVKNPMKAKEGCLPFCFESNQNIFPAEDGIFRHYCRAEGLWQCKRKGCKQGGKALSEARMRFRQNHGTGPAEGNDAEKAGAGGGNLAADDSGDKKSQQTEWFSAVCWYHEHLKDRDTQGLKKGFERQYCNACWRKSKEWVEGKVLAFAKCGYGRIDDEGAPKKRHAAGGKDEDLAELSRREASSKAAPHRPEVCLVCSRLKMQGFEDTCLRFAEWLAAGYVVVRPGDKSWAWGGGVGSHEEAKIASARRHGGRRRR
eukprot:g12597.t1